MIKDNAANPEDGQKYVIDNFSIKAYMVETATDDTPKTKTRKVAKAPKTNDILFDVLH